MNPVAGKVILVTGGANGIGLAYVTELLANEAKGVTIVDINKEAGEMAVEKFTKEYGPRRVIYVYADVCKESEFEDAFRKTVATFKQFDILINNAGTLNEVNWERTLAINVAGMIKGTILATEKYLKYRSGSEGIVVNTSSVSAFSPLAVAPVYSATKCAVIGFSMSYGTPEHYAKYPVRVMTICPGATITKLTSDSVTPEVVGWYFDIVEEYPNKYYFQEPEDVAKALMIVLQKGNNGSVWIAEDSNEPYEAVVKYTAKL